MLRVAVLAALVNKRLGFDVDELFLQEHRATEPYQYYCMRLGASRCDPTRDLETDSVWIVAANRLCSCSFDRNHVSFGFLEKGRHVDAEGFASTSHHQPIRLPI